MRRAFGIATEDEVYLSSLHEEVESGLLLYCETFALLKKALLPDDCRLIEATFNAFGPKLEGDG